MALPFAHKLDSVLMVVPSGAGFELVWRETAEAGARSSNVARAHARTTFLDKCVDLMKARATFAAR